MTIAITTIGIVSLYSLVKRFKNNPSGSLINPLFHLLLFSILYLLLPLYYIDLALDINNKIDVSRGAVSIAGYFSLWYVVVFNIFYYFSDDIKCNLTNFKLPTQKTTIIKVIYIIICLILLYIVIKFVPTIYTLKADRISALAYYEIFVNSAFKLRIIMYIHLILMFILFISTKRLVYLLPCILYLIIDHSHGGRTVTLMIFTFCYFILTLKKKRTYFNYAIFAVILMIYAGLNQRSNSPDFYWNLYMSGAEFSNTYLTSLYCLTNPTYTASGYEYAIISFSKLFPGGIVDKILNFGEWYGNDLSDEIGLGYGLAGNIMTEALVYGGRIFCFFQPLLIGFFLYLLNQNNHRKKLGGVLYSLLISIAIQNIMRSYFWGYILYPCQFLVFYFFWLKDDYSKSVFVK